MILFIICAAWISGPLLLLGFLWIQYYSWTWFHIWLPVPAFPVGNRYEILAGTAIWSRHVFTPDMALSSELSVSSWAFMDSHILAYLFCWQMHKSECLGNPIVVFAWIFYVFRTEPASNFCIPFIEWDLISKDKTVLIIPHIMVVVIVRNLPCLESVKSETLLLHYLSKSN